MVLNNQILCKCMQLLPLYRCLFSAYHLGCKKILINMFNNHNGTPGLLIHILAAVVVGTVARNSQAKLMHNSDKQHQGVQCILLFTP